MLEALTFSIFSFPQAGEKLRSVDWEGSMQSVWLLRFGAARSAGGKVSPRLMLRASWLMEAENGEGGTAGYAAEGKRWKLKGLATKRLPRDTKKKESRATDETEIGTDGADVESGRRERAWNSVIVNLCTLFVKGGGAAIFLDEGCYWRGGGMAVESAIQGDLTWRRTEPGRRSD